MTTVVPHRTSTYAPSDFKSRPASSRGKREQSRSDIWSNLLRQTREAQARSRTQSLQHRSLLLLGGKPEDQQNFVEKYVARKAPPRPPTTSGRKEGKERREKGEVRLSNRFAYGYGHVTLFSPPSDGAGGSGSLMGGEAEEAARVELHCLPGEAEKGYEETLRTLLRPKKDREVAESDKGEDKVEGGTAGGDEESGRRSSVVLFMSWKEPWTFISSLRAWFALLARALLPEQAGKDEKPLEVLKEHALSLTLVLQHVEAQEGLERENYREESFDYISQTLRTCLLPLSAALVYTPTTPAPSQPSSPLSEIQKLLYASLQLDVGALQTRRPGSAGAGAQAKKEELLPRHNVVDRMAILVPSGWDSIGKIRLLSETFSPEVALEGWLADLEKSAALFSPPANDSLPPQAGAGAQQEVEEDDSLLQANGTVEMYSSAPSPTPESPLDDRPMSPSKLPKSAIISYELQIQDPSAHKKSPPPRLEVTTKPEQDFLGEMRAQLQHYEAQDTERAKKEPGLVSTTAGALNLGNRDGSGALSELGNVSFNVGGVNYNTVSAEAAIERLKRPTHPSCSGGGEASPTMSGTPRTGTPRPPRREGGGGSGETPNTSARGELQTDKLEEYFASLMKRGGGGSAQSTPSKPPQ